MHKRFFYLVLFLSLMILAACGPGKEDAISYNDAIVVEQDRAADAMDKVFNSLRSYTNHAGMDSAYAYADETVNTVTNNLKEMDDFDGNAGFRDTAVLIMTSYRSILDNEMKELISIYKLPDTAFTPERKEAFGKLQTQVLSRLESELRMLKSAQWNFALKYDFEELLRNEEYIKAEDRK